MSLEVYESKEGIMGPNMYTILAEARAAADFNTEIIQRVSKEQSAIARLYDLNFEVPGKAKVQEREETLDVQDYLEDFEYPSKITLVEIPGIAETKSGAKACTRWEDAVSLNSQFEAIVADLEVYGNGSAKAIIRSQQLSDNLAALSPMFENIQHTLFESAGTSKLEKLNQQIEELNTLATAIMTDAGTSLRELVIDSKIFKEIPKTNFGLEKLLRNGTLIYRGSTNGFASSDFHKQCDEKGATVTLIKTTVGNIFGGYNPISWD